MMKLYRHLAVTFAIAVLALWLVVAFVVSSNYEELRLKNLEYAPQRTFKLLDILSDGDELLEDFGRKKIFFIESHTNQERKVDNPRQACSVESAARVNPDMEVYFIFATNSSEVDMNYSELLESLLKYSNVHLRFLNPKEFSRGTLLEDFFENDRMKDSSFPVEHLSDVLRLLLLNRYGGQYLDLDVLSLVPLSVVNHENFLCPQDPSVFTNAVMNFDLNKGSAIIEETLKKLRISYQPKAWTANGLNMISAVIRSHCPGLNITMESITQCGDVTLLPSKKCYPLMFPDWRYFYEEKYRDIALKNITDSGSYFVHIWNKVQEFSHANYKLSFTSRSAYVELAKNYCPLVLKTIEKYF